MQTFVNNWSTTLSAAPASLAKALTVPAADAATLQPLASVDSPVRATLEAGSSIEIILITAADGTTGNLTVVREQEGTSEPSAGWPSGASISARLTAESLKNLPPPGDFAPDPTTTSGLTWGYGAGRVHATSVSAGTVTLTASATNYVEVDNTGTVSVNQTGFTPGRYPLREIVAGGAAITTSTDRRRWLTPAGVMTADGSVPMSGALQMGGNPVQGYTERSAAVSSSGTATLDLSTGRLFAVTLTANTTIAFSNVPPAGVTSCTVELIQDATGSRTVTWPASVTWAGGAAPTISSAANAVDVVTLYTRDGGTTWRGFMAGQGMA